MCGRRKAEKSFQRELIFIKLGSANTEGLTECLSLNSLKSRAKGARSGQETGEGKQRKMGSNECDDLYVSLKRQMIHRQTDR